MKHKWVSLALLSSALCHASPSWAFVSDARRSQDTASASREIAARVGVRELRA